MGVRFPLPGGAKPRGVPTLLRPTGLGKAPSTAADAPFKSRQIMGL